MPTGSHRPPVLGAAVASLPPGLTAAVRTWLEADPDPTTRAELEHLVATGDGEEVAARFDGHLRFGTSGLRAPLGAGPRRMNRLVVRQVATGLVRWLEATGAIGPGGSSGAEGAVGPGDVDRWSVVVGHDARHGSAAFAADIADVVAALGGEPVRFDQAVPTPVAVWATTRTGAVAAVVCTASHNPPSDNGCKVYVGDGAQPVAPDDAALAAAMAAAGTGGGVPPVGEAPPAVPTGPVVDGYVAHVAGLVASAPARPVLVHTALHGVAWPVLRQVFGAAGYDEPVPVGTQAEPDPDFPTTPYPNPEEAGALVAAVALARQCSAVAVLANDPDGDRLGLAVPAPAGLVEAIGPDVALGQTGWVRLTGDQLGWLLADHLLARGSGPDRLVVSTFETSSLLARLAAHHGVEHQEVPTGFKWIARAAMARTDLRFVCGYEEALGYSVDGSLPDKDGIAAALVAAEVVATATAAGATVWDRLEVIARQVGHHATATRSWRLEPGASSSIQAAMTRLRSVPPAVVAGRPIDEVVDLATGVLGPPADAVVLHLVGGDRLVVRPSGTENKLKVYAETVGGLDDRPHAFVRAEIEGRRTAGASADALLGWLRPG